MPIAYDANKLDLQTVVVFLYGYLYNLHLFLCLSVCAGHAIGIVSCRFYNVTCAVL